MPDPLLLSGVSTGQVGHRHLGLRGLQGLVDHRIHECKWQTSGWVL